MKVWEADVYFEQNMVPEYCILENVEDEGLYEDILRLVSSDAEQIKRQMIHRYHNEGGLYDLGNV